MIIIDKGLSRWVANRNGLPTAFGECQLATSASSVGAGAAMSLGKKIRALTANKATRKTSTIKKGAMY